MANRITIRHGTSIPTTSDLLPYELGWYNGNNNAALYINNNGTIKKLIDCNEIHFLVSGNDYAEYRKSNCKEPGRVVAIVENSKPMEKTTERLQKCAHVISDTYGMVIGEQNDSVPIAVSGRVLVYPFYPKTMYTIGDVVCAAANGTVDIMNRYEIRDYPDRILGIVDEIPESGEKIWIQIK